MFGPEVSRVDDHDALCRTIVAHPEDDLPRLVYADWIEEHGETDRAGFIRDQIEFARHQPWEPYAARCRNARPNTITGQPWRASLPKIEPRFWEWNPKTPFHRGFGWSLIVRDLMAFLSEAERLFAEAPIGQLYLPTSTLDQWIRFAEQPWLPCVKSIHFYGVTTPIEPLRVLCATSAATGLEELVLEKASGPAIPVLLEDLFQSPLGRQLKKLVLHAGGDRESEWVAPFRTFDHTHQLQELCLITMNVSEPALRLLTECPILSQLTRFKLKRNPLFDSGVVELALCGVLQNVTRLSLVDCLASPDSANVVVQSPYFGAVRQLDLSRNRLDNELNHDTRRVLPHWSHSKLKSLESVRLRGTRFDDAGVSELVKAPFWSNLVELDLRDNPLTDGAARHLLGAPPPANLTALLLNQTLISADMVQALQQHFGADVVLRKASDEGNSSEAGFSATGAIR